MTKKLLNLTLGAALAVALTTTARAGTFTWNFDDWLNGSGGENALLYASDDADTIPNVLYKQSAGGSPDTGGFLQLTPAVDSHNLSVLFPDIDGGAPVKAFKVSLDVRAGNGADEHAADGFSISYVRENDPALLNVIAGTGGGFAGGDDCATAQSAAGGGNRENGSKTGVAILFDTWQGNTLPNTAANPNCVAGNDVEGMAVRVDDKTLTQVSMTSWNGDCANTNSLQTGPWANDGGTAWSGLSWCKLEVEKTADNKVYVTWKGRKVVDGYQLTAYPAHKGRILLAGRTGGNNQQVHFDNIVLETTPAIEPIADGLTINGDLRGWAFKTVDTLPSAATNFTKVLWNGTDVTSAVTWSKSGTSATISYSQAARLPANSPQKVTVTLQTSLAQTIEIEQNATVMDYFIMPTVLAKPESAVAGQTRGIVLGQMWQTIAPNNNSQGDNRLNWTEEQTLGLHGANLIADPTPASTDVIDYQNEGSRVDGTDSGNFVASGAPDRWVGPDYTLWNYFGTNTAKIDNTDAGTIEWSAYVRFPTAGDYYMIVNSDDGFRLTVARNAKDRMGSVFSLFEGGRGNGTGLGAGTSQRVIIEQAGVYAIRGIIENGGGGFNVEWYTRVGDQLYLVNSTPASALQAWQSATDAGCYVASAIPVRSAVDVPANQKIIIELANGTTTITGGFIVLKVDGATVTPAITSGATTKLELDPVGAGNLWPSGSAHTIDLTFSDSASTAYSYTWAFTAAPYKVLSGGAPLGSQDTSKVGFMYSTAQADPQGSVTFPNNIYVGEQVIQGGWAPNTATLASGPVSGVINFNIATDDQGNFHDGNGYPEGLIPGIPGTSSLPNEWFACEILTYVEFPTAGFYSMGFNSDDGFWTRLGHARPANICGLTITSPTALAGVKAGLLPAIDSAQVVLPTNSVTGELVLANPVDASSALNNAAQVAGKIAVCYRGVVSFAAKIQTCAAAGAIGVIIVQNRPDANPAEGSFPIGMAATTGPVPSTMIRLADGNAITNALGSGTVTGTINAMPDLSEAIGYADYGKGASDINFHMLVPTPGLYPLRTMWWQGNGGGNAEWFSIKDGVKTLLNDGTKPAALKTWYGVNYVPPPTLTVGKAGANIVITYTGTLQSAGTVNGTYTDVSGATSPYSSPISSAPLFFRARQ